MRALGRRLAALLRSGDVVLLTGPLGAGKTTLTQGIGAGLGVRGPVTSPTFVIARVHRPLRAGGPALVHADGYRLGGPAELDDLDLDAGLEHSVTVMEWGEGLAEQLSADYLQVTIARAAAGQQLPGQGSPRLGPQGQEQGSDGQPESATPAAADPDSSESRLVSVRGHGPRWRAENKALTDALGALLA